jgi:hypothetical protein
MLWWWQHGNVLDTFVIGLACTICRACIARLRSGFGFVDHVGLLLKFKNLEWLLVSGKKKPPGVESGGW